MMDIKRLGKINLYEKLDKPVNRIYLILISSVYIMFFLMIFNPLGFFDTFTSFSRLGRLLSFGPKWAVILLFNEFILRNILLKRVKWNLFISLLWFIWEALSLGAGTLLYDYFFNTEYYRSPYVIIGWILQQMWIYLFPFILTHVIIRHRDAQKKIVYQEEILLKLSLNDDTRITIKGKNKLEILSIQVRDFIYAEAKGNYIHITYIGNGNEIKSYLIRSTMRELEDQLSQFNIVQIHRSYLVNYCQIEKFRRQDGKMVVSLKNDFVLPVSSTYYSSIIRPV
ncbi:LytR/AlgR family response regulator transcription factor [Bacteroidota bacterium]